MNKKTEKKLRAITESVPQELRDKLVTRDYIAPDVRNAVIEQLIEELTDPEEIKEQRRLQNMFDAGFYDAMEDIVDPEIAKQIDEFVENKIQEAIDAGDLPDPSKIDDYKAKTKRNERRKQKSGVRAKQGGKGARSVRR